MSAYDNIITSLNRFIRKYHINQLIKGSIYLCASVLLLFLLIITLEYFGAFSSKVRTVLVFSFLLSCVALLFKFMLLPIFQLFQLRKGLDHKGAAKIIGTHFPSISDKLLNIIELKEIANQATLDSADLIEAGIEQKSDEIKPVPILSAINFGENKKHAKYALVPLTILLIGLFTIPDYFSEPSKRFLAYDKEFIPKAPFNISFSQSNFEVAKGSDFTFSCEINDGQVVPTAVAAKFKNYKENLHKTGPRSYSITFKNVQEDFQFDIESEGFFFGTIEVAVQPLPLVSKFQMKLDYPNHTELSPKVFEKSGDAIVPEGTKITWVLSGTNSDSINIHGVPDLKTFKFSEEVTESNWLADADIRYGVYRENSFVTQIDSNTYGIQVTRDQFPEITGSMITDSIGLQSAIINVNIRDDYGFTKLLLKIADNNKKEQVIPIELSKDLRQQELVQPIDLQELNIEKGQTFSYYLEVWDNDGFRGPKSSKTLTKTVKIKSEEELVNDRNKQVGKGEKNLRELNKSSEDLQKSLSDLKKELLEKPSPDLNDKRRMQSILKERAKLEEQLDQLKKDMQQAESLQKNITPENEELLKKQEELNDLMEDLMTDELKAMYEELEKLMQEMDQEKILDQLDKIDQQTENMSEELDRSLELLKKLALELKTEDLADKLEKLADKQKDAQKENDAEKSKDAQKEINQEFDDVKKELDNLKKESDSLNTDLGLEDTEKNAEELDKQLQETQDNLNHGKQKKAKEQQGKNAQKMQEMAAQMKSSLSNSSSEENAENIEDLKQILENLITLSFDQEALYNKFDQVSTQDPRYTELSVEQVKYQSDFTIIEDSLNALAKRVAQIQPIIRKEVDVVKSSMNQAKDLLQERVTSKAQMNQRYATTSLNNLALLLDEVLQQLQKQDSKSKPGMANCNKPKSGESGKPSLKQFRKAQEEMAKKMEEMMKKVGKQEGGQQKKPGEKGDQGEGAKQLVQMAAKQAALRKQLREMAKDLNKDGSGNGNKLNEIAKELEKIEEDIFNNDINPESLRRQQEIISKMLEEENAERNQEYENKREGEQGQNRNKINPDWQKYIEERRKQIEQLQSVPNKLQPYYKKKSEEFLNEINPQ